MNNEQEMIVKKLWGKYPFLYNTSLGMYWIGNGVFVADNIGRKWLDEYEDFIERIKKDAEKDNLKQIYYSEIQNRYKKALFNVFDKLVKYGKTIKAEENIQYNLENFIERLGDNDIITLSKQIECFGIVYDWSIKHEIEIESRKEKTK